jgi:hypothetical protein
MKTRFKYILILFAITFMTNISCSDYLIEDNKTGATEDVIYSTKSGLDGLVAASYSYLRGWYGKQGGLYLSEGGTDTWLTGYDNQEKILVDYSNISPEVATTMNPMFDQYWELLYTAINTCNTGIKYVQAAPVLVISESDKNTYLVIDATTGQNAIAQAKEFAQVTDLSGIILTKIEGTAKGGIVCAISSELNLPVVFLGVGEGIEDLQPFDAQAFAQSLFD